GRRAGGNAKANLRGDVAARQDAEAEARGASMIAQLEYAPHELAKMFPPMSAEEKRDLAADIKRNGLLEPIITYDGKILDGVHRAAACLNAGREPRYLEFDKLPK